MYVKMTLDSFNDMISVTVGGVCFECRAAVSQCHHTVHTGRNLRMIYLNIFCPVVSEHACMLCTNVMHCLSWLYSVLSLIRV